MWIGWDNCFESLPWNGSKSELNNRILSVTERGIVYCALLILQLFLKIAPLACCGGIWYWLAQAWFVHWNEVDFSDAASINRPPKEGFQFSDWSSPSILQFRRNCVLLLRRMTMEHDRHCIVTKHTLFCSACPVLHLSNGVMRIICCVKLFYEMLNCFLTKTIP